MDAQVKKPCRRCGKGMVANYTIIERHFIGGVNHSVPTHFSGLCKSCRCENLFGKGWQGEFSRRGIKSPVES